MHLADAFIQSNLQLHSGYTFHQYVCSLGIEPTTLCAANAMLYHWATGTVIVFKIKLLELGVSNAVIKKGNKIIITSLCCC